jgi:hypothetical protein
MAQESLKETLDKWNNLPDQNPNPYTVPPTEFATEQRSSVRQRLYESTIENQHNNVMREIKKASEAGLFKLPYSNLHDQVKKRLVSYGLTIEYSTGNTYCIYWD